MEIAIDLLYLGLLGALAAATEALIRLCARLLPGHGERP